MVVDVQRPARRLSSREMAGRIRESLPATDVVSRYWEAPVHGMVHCPFHAGDDTASLRVYPGSRGWYCFGCQQGGDVISFVMRHLGLTFPQALARLDTDFSLGLGSGTAAPPEDPARALQQAKEQADRKARQQQLDDLAVLEAKCAKARRRCADLVASGEQYWDNPHDAPEWWLDAAMGLEWTDMALTGIDRLRGDLDDTD